MTAGRNPAQDNVDNDGKEINIHGERHATDHCPAEQGHDIGKARAKQQKDADHGNQLHDQCQHKGGGIHLAQWRNHPAQGQ